MADEDDLNPHEWEKVMAVFGFWLTILDCLRTQEAQVVDDSQSSIFLIFCSSFFSFVACLGEGRPEAQVNRKGTASKIFLPVLKLLDYEVSRHI